MDKEQFVNDLKSALIYHFNEIKENEPIISYGIYTDGDASTIGIYYNTRKRLENHIKNVEQEYTGDLIETMSLYYTFCMEEWEKDISDILRDKRLLELATIIDKYGSSEYEKGNENWKDEIFDLLSNALNKAKETELFKNESEDFFIHLGVSDDFTDDRMLDRMSTILDEKRFIDYKKYSEED